MALYINKIFSGEDVELDGHTFQGCTFQNCNLIYRGGQPPSLVNNSFNDFRFTFLDSALFTLLFMSALYKAGFDANIERTFDNIRGDEILDADIIN